jgi:thiol-disulfide isomerase/thioredoxin
MLKENKRKMSFHISSGDEPSEPPTTDTSTTRETQDGVHVFTADWCGYCKKMKGETPEILISEPGYKVVEHDSNDPAWKPLWEQHVKGKYPTILFKLGGTIARYKGIRSLASIQEGLRSFNEEHKVYL